MPPRFTTYDRVMLKVKGRLYLDESPHIGGTVVTTEEIDAIALDQEGYIEAVLGMIYLLPLVGIDPMIGRMATNLIASELMTQNFQGSAFASESSDVSNLAVNLRRDAESIMVMVTAGHGISVPGMPVPQNNFFQTAQPVVLQGETLRTDSPDTISRNVTVTGKLTQATGNQDPYGFFGIADRTNPHNQRAYGTAPVIIPLEDYE